VDLALKVLRNLAINAALGMVVPLLLWCFNPAISRTRLMQTFWISQVYSNCIGLLFSTFMSRIWMFSNSLGSVAAAWSLRLFACLGMATLGTLAGTFLVLATGLVRDAPFWPFFWDGYRFALVITVSVGGLLMLYESMKVRLEVTTVQLKQKELERERAMTVAAEATLASLESRIHPHFLFNTINSVSSLIPEDPAKAERLLGQMSQLLRFSLDSAQTGLVPLEKEMKIVEDYLEIEQARFGDRLQFTLNWSDPGNYRVPPLSIQTLVENSVKHAIAPRREGGRVEVSTIIVPGPSLVVSVTDDGPGFDLAAAIAGHGLDLLERRLKAFLPNHPGLHINSTPGRCTVNFGVPRS